MLQLQNKEVHQVERYTSNKIFYREELQKRYGVRYSIYREKWAKASKGKLITEFPLHIDLDTVDKCNLKCSHCQEENTRDRTNMKISNGLVDKIFTEASNYGLCAVNIGSVGEPSLEKDILFYILKHAENAKVMETFVHTNGLLMDKRISEQFIDSNLTYLCISVDASTEQTYKKIRGANFLRLKNNIEEFVNLRKSKKQIFPLLRLSFLNTKSNFSEKQAFIDVWSNLADIIDFQPLIDYHSENKKHTRNIDSCFNPFMRLMIGSSGELGACCAGISFNEDIILGYFPEVSIYEAWNSQRIKEIRRGMLNLKLDKFPTCLDCLSRR